MSHIAAIRARCWRALIFRYTNFYIAAPSQPCLKITYTHNTTQHVYSYARISMFNIPAVEVGGNIKAVAKFKMAPVNQGEICAPLLFTLKKPYNIFLE